MKELAGYEWNFGKLSGLSVDDLWTCAKADITVYDTHVYIALDKRVNFER